MERLWTRVFLFVLLLGLLWNDSVCEKVEAESTTTAADTRESTLRKRQLQGHVGPKNPPSHRGPNQFSKPTFPSPDIVYHLNDEEAKALQSIVEQIERPMLNKAAASPTKRLLFVVGLEGAGHHMVAALMKKCGEVTASDPRLRNMCVKEEVIPDLLFRVHRNRQAPGPNGVRNDKHYGLFGSSGYINHGKYLVEIHKRLVELVNSKDVVEGTPVFMHINGKDSPVHGMLSYPNYDGVNRNLHNPDLHILAAIAESAGIDLRLLVLQRSAKELYESVIDRFTLPTPLMGMANSATNLFSQLYRIDPAFYSCVPYHDVGKLDESKLKKLATFLHPTLAEKDAETFKLMASVVTDHVRPAEIMPNSTHWSDTLNKRVVVPRGTIVYHQALYQGKIQMIDDLCAKNENSVRVEAQLS